MGGGEVVFELNDLVDHEGWQKAWLQYSKLTTAPKEVVTKDMTTGTEGSDGAYARPDRLAAYVYMKTKNPAFAQKALTALTGRRGSTSYATRRVEARRRLSLWTSLRRVGTNALRSIKLSCDSVLEMCVPDSWPKTMPPPMPDRPPGRPENLAEPQDSQAPRNESQVGKGAALAEPSS